MELNNTRSEWQAGWRSESQVQRTGVGSEGWESRAMKDDLWSWPGQNLVQRGTIMPAPTLFLQWHYRGWCNICNMAITSSASALHITTDTIDQSKSMSVLYKSLLHLGSRPSFHADVAVQNASPKRLHVVYCSIRLWNWGGGGVPKNTLRGSKNTLHQLNERFVCKGQGLHSSCCIQCSRKEVLHCHIWIYSTDL